MRPIILLLILSILPAVSPAEDTAFLTGVLRSDGIIVPFACFDGSGWETPWPEADASPDTAFASLDALPKAWYAPLASPPREWYVRNTSGGFRAVTVDRPAGVAVRGSLAVGLRTGLTSQPQRPSAAPFSRVSTPAPAPEGLAFSRNAGFRATANVGRESAEWTVLVSAIRRAFVEDEAKRGHPLPAEVRAREELQVLSLFRGETDPDGSAIYCFETVRNYVTGGLLPVTSPAGCARLRGWIRRDRTGTPAFLEKEFILERFAAPVEPALAPLGMIVLGGQIFWMVRERNGGSETYSVLEIGREGVRKHASTFAGGN